MILSMLTVAKAIL